MAKKLSAGRLAVLGAALVPALAVGAARAAPLEAYVKLPAMDQVSISPDGSKIAFAQSVNGKFAIVVDQLSPASVVLNMAPADQPVRGLIWADPSHLLVVRSPTSAGPGALGETYLVTTVDLDKHRSAPLPNFTANTGEQVKAQGAAPMNTISEMPRVSVVDGRTTVFARGAVVGDIGAAPALISSDLAAGKDRVLESSVPTDPGRRWILDDRGEQIAQTRYSEADHGWTLRIKQGGRWIDAYSAKVQFIPPQLLGQSGDGAALLLKIIKDGGAAEYRAVSLADGKVSEPLADYEGYSTLIHDPASQRIIGGVKTGMEPAYVFFDPKDQASWTTVLSSFPDEQVDPISWSHDRSKVVVRVTGVRRGIVYALVDLASRKATMIGQARAGITGADLADVNIVKYPAQDGMPINAFLTLPIGKDLKNLPLIVLAHDGPAGRDESGFDWWAQALASRGYAVLQPQYRGSTGFDSKLETGGVGEFGRKMQTDLSDGVRALASKGYIDPKRVCIVGAGYGGYAALAGVTIEQGVYRCAVAIAGASDLRKLIGNRSNAPFGASPGPLWDRYVGAKGQTDPIYDQISPVSHAAQAGGPVLLIHDHEDSVSPIQQSWDMEAALKKANKPVELVTLAGDDHGLAREATRLQALQATVTFLEKNNPPQ